MQSSTFSSNKQGKIENANIKHHDYCRTLLAETERRGLVSKEDAVRVKGDWVKAREELINACAAYEGNELVRTGGGGNRIMMSLLFSMDTCLLSLADTEEAIDALLHTPALELYHNGQHILRQYLYEAAGCLVKVKRSSLSLPNTHYRKTVNESLFQALKAYDIRFGAHLVKRSMDYLLAVRPSNLRGIYYLRGYMMNLCAENNFCREYDEKEIEEVYRLYCRNNGMNYREARVNIYAVVFSNALFCEYLRKEPGELIITEDECDIIEELLGSLEPDMRGDMLINIASKMLGGDREYNIKTAKMLVPRFQNAIERRRLKKYITCIL